MRGVEAAMLPSALDPPGFAIARTFLAVAKESGLRWLVNLSGLSAPGETPTTAGRWHAEADALVEASGIPFVHLRPAAFFQNVLEFAGEVSAKGILADPFGGSAIPYIDARDVASAAVELLSAPGKGQGGAVSLTSPGLVTHEDLARALTAELGREVGARSITPAAMRERLLSSGVPSVYAEAMEDVYTRYAQNRFVTTPDYQRLVGIPPRSAAEFVRDYRSAFLR